MLSKRVKERIAKNKERRRIPKKRRSLLILRRYTLGALKSSRNSMVGAHASFVVNEQALMDNLAAHARLRQKFFQEDRVYFNGWRKGHK